MSKADVRTACRMRWGKDWYKVHPVIKKARMTWAAGGDREARLVLVHEGSETYVASRPMRYPPQTPPRPSGPKKPPRSRR